MPQISDEHATTTNRGLAGAALQEPPQMGDDEAKKHAAAYLAQTTGEEEDEPKTRQRGRKEDRGQDREERRPQRRAARDDFEDDDDELDDDAPEGTNDSDEDDFDDEDQDDIDRREVADEDDDLDEDNEDFEDEEEEDDTLEDRRRTRRRASRDDDEDGDNKVLRGLKRRLGVQKGSSARKAVHEIIRNFDDVSSRFNSGAGPQRDAAGSSRRDAAPSKDEGSEDEEKLLKEIDEWKPEAGKLMRSLQTKLGKIENEYRQSEFRRSMRELNGQVNTLAKSLGLEKVYGRDTRRASERQSERREALIRAAGRYALQLQAQGHRISEEEALEHAMMAMNRRRVRESIEKRTERRVERSVRKRARTHLDMVSERGGGGRDRGGSDDSDERSALKYAAEYQASNGFSRSSRRRRAG